MLVLVTVMSCPCYLNNFPLELTRCCEANFGFETLTKPQGEGSAAWAVALQFTYIWRTVMVNVGYVGKYTIH